MLAGARTLKSSAAPGTGPAGAEVAWSWGGASGPGVCAGGNACRAGSCAGAKLCASCCPALGGVVDRSLAGTETGRAWWSLRSLAGEGLGAAGSWALATSLFVAFLAVFFAAGKGALPEGPTMVGPSWLALWGAVVWLLPSAAAGCTPCQGTAGTLRFSTDVLSVTHWRLGTKLRPSGTPSTCCAC